MRCRALVAVSVLCCGLLLTQNSPPIRAQEAAAPSPLSIELQALVHGFAAGSHSGVTVRRALTGEVVFDHQADVARNPASNMKVLTAALALHALGPEHRFRTSVHGRMNGNRIEGGLYLRGQGDPLLDRGDLSEMIRELVARGIREVDEVVIDASFFDEQYLPPAFEQQPAEVAPFRAAISPVSIDGNAYTLRVRPGEVGQPAQVVLDGAGYFVLSNRLMTVAEGAPNVIADQHAVRDRMELRLSGQIGAASSLLSYRRRIENPTAWAGHVFRDLLVEQEIRVTGAIRVSHEPLNGVPLLVQHTSAPLAEVVTRMGKQSDNFVAEMVFRAVGAEASETPQIPATTAQSIAALQAFLGDIHATTADLHIVNGSGLFRGNLVAPSTFARVLTAMYQDSTVRHEFVSHLAIAGADGTLASRFANVPQARRIRAKTGTLNDTIALSGFVLGDRDADTYVFSVLCNDVAGHQSEARQFADAVASAILRSAIASRS